MMDMTLILARRYPSSEWFLNGNEYKDLVWLSNDPKPSEKKLESLWPLVEAEAENEIIQQKRRLEYEKYSDPIFFDYQRGEKTKEDWDEAVSNIKANHPYREVS